MSEWTPDQFAGGTAVAERPARREMSPGEFAGEGRAAKSLTPDEFAGTKASVPEVTERDTFRTGSGIPRQSADPDAFAARGLSGSDVAGKESVQAGVAYRAGEAVESILGPVEPSVEIPVNEVGAEVRHFDFTQNRTSPLPTPGLGTRESSGTGLPGNAAPSADALPVELAASIPRAIYRGGSNLIRAVQANPLPVGNPITNQYPAYDQAAVDRAAEDQKKRDALAAQSGLLPPPSNTPAVQAIEGVGTKVVETAPLLAAAAPIAIPSRVAGAAGTAAKYLGAGPVTAGAASGAAGTAAALTEFNVLSGAMDTAQTGDRSKIAEGAVHMPASLAKFAPGGEAPDIDSYINAILLGLGAGYGAYRAPKAPLAEAAAPEPPPAAGPQTPPPGAQPGPQPGQAGPQPGPQPGQAGAGAGPRPGAGQQQRPGGQQQRTWEDDLNDRSRRYREQRQQEQQNRQQQPPPRQKPGQGFKAEDHPELVAHIERQTEDGLRGIISRYEVKLAAEADPARRSVYEGLLNLAKGRLARGPSVKPTPQAAPSGKPAARTPDEFAAGKPSASPSAPVYAPKTPSATASAPSGSVVSTPGGVPGSSKPFQPLQPAPSVPSQPVAPPAPVQPPPAAQAPQNAVKRYFRTEEKGDAVGSVDKPHGLYVTPKADSPHADLGGEVSEWELAPDAKVLDLKGSPPIVVRRGAVNSGAGVHAASSLLPKEVFEDLMSGNKANARRIANELFPGPDYARYFDKQEIIEAIGGMAARRAGYDAIDFPDARDSSFNEVVLLTNKAHRVVKPPIQETANVQGQTQAAPQAEAPTAEAAQAQVRPTGDTQRIPVEQPVQQVDSGVAASRPQAAAAEEAATVAPAPKAPPRRFTKPDIDSKLTKAMGTVEGTSKREQFAMTIEARSAAARAGEANIEEGTDVTTPAMFSEAFKELNPRQKRAVKMLGVVVSDDIAQSQIEMAGEKLYDDAINEIVQGGDIESRLDAFAGRVAKNPGLFDEETRLMAYLRSKWSGLTLEQRNAKQEIINPQELPTGTKVTIRGESFEVVREGGETSLKDGINLNVDNVNAVPIDKGSVKEPGAPKKTSGQQLGLLGDKTAGGITGSNTGSLFETRPSTSKAAEEDAAFRAKQTPKDSETADMFDPPKPPASGGGGNNTIDDAGDSFLSDEGGAIGLDTFEKGLAWALRSAYDTTNFFTGQQLGLIERWSEGRLLGRILRDGESYARALWSKVDNDFADAWKGLSRKDKRWLKDIDKTTGHSNIQRMTEDIPGVQRITPPNAALKKYADVYQKALDITGDEAIKKGIQRLDANGNYINFTKKKGGAFIRYATAPLQDAMHAGYRHDPFLDAYAKHLMSRPANAGMKIEHIKDYLFHAYGPDPVRKVGALEHVRTIPDMPTHFPMPDGTWMQALETDGYLVPRRGFEMMGKRIFFASEFGQSLKGEPGKLEKLRHRFVSQPGAAKYEQSFDNAIGVYFGRPVYRVNWLHPRHGVKRALNIAFSGVKALQTSASFLPQLFQPMMALPYAGVKALAQGTAKFFTHPFKSNRDAAEMAGLARQVMDWNVRPGEAPEDISRLMFEAVSTPFRVINRWAQIWSAQVAMARAEQMAIHGIGPEEAKWYGLTKREMIDINTGQMTAELKQKVTQALLNKFPGSGTEYSVNRPTMQNIPAVRQVFSYQNYGAEALKSTARIAWEFGQSSRAFWESPTPANANRVGRALRRVFYHLLGMGLAGAGGIVTYKLATGKPIIDDDETLLGFAGKSLYQSQILGTTQRVLDSATYSGDNVDRFLIGLSPTLSAMKDVFGAAIGMGPYSKFPKTRQLYEAFKKNAPLYKMLLKQYNEIFGESTAEYERVRSQASKYEREVLGKESSGGGLHPINPDYEPVRKMLMEKNWKEAIIAGKKMGIEKAKTDRSKTRDEWMEGLRSSLLSARPIPMNEKERRTFLAKLSPEDRVEYLKLDRAWENAVKQMTFKLK